MSDVSWYERRPVTSGTLAMVIVALPVLLATPFIDKTWPTKLGAVLASPWARLILLAMALGGAYALGYVLGRRRPDPGPPFTVATAPVVAGDFSEQDDLRHSTLWEQLHSRDRLLLSALWQAERRFIRDDEIAAFRKLHDWSAAQWNAVEQTLVRGRGLMRRRLNAHNELGWELTDAGSALMAWEHRTDEAIRNPAD